MQKLGWTLALSLALFGCSRPATTSDLPDPTGSPLPGTTATPTPAPTLAPSPAPSVSPTPVPVPVAGRYIVRTIAGTGDSGYWGSGISALEATLKGPCGLTWDPMGNVYFADYGNHRLRLIDTTGTIQDFAGMGAQGFSGDGGPAYDSQMYYPFSVTYASDGSILFADYSNARIRKIGTDGVISTLVGGGSDRTDGALATDAALDGPTQVTFGPQGELFIADFGGHRLLKVANGKVTRIAGTGTAGFSGDGGPALAAEINNPVGIAVAWDGTVFFSDYGNHRIRKVDSEGNISTIAGTSAFGTTGDGGLAINAQLYNPTGIALDAEGALYIADTGNNRIRVIKKGYILAVAGNGMPGFEGDNGEATSAQFNNPIAVALTPSGKIAVSDYSNNRIRVLVPIN